MRTLRRLLLPVILFLCGCNGCVPAISGPTMPAPAPEAPAPEPAISPQRAQFASRALLVQAAHALDYAAGALKSGDCDGFRDALDHAKRAADATEPLLEACGARCAEELQAHDLITSAIAQAPAECHVAGPGATQL